MIFILFKKEKWIWFASNSVKDGVWDANGYLHFAFNLHKVTEEIIPICVDEKNEIQRHQQSLAIPQKHNNDIYL